jgi:hypothetical protein
MKAEQSSEMLVSYQLYLYTALEPERPYLHYCVEPCLTSKRTHLENMSSLNWSTPFHS